jgi:hypothetical protein
MTKQIDVRIAGQERIETVEIDEATTAADVLELVGLRANGFELSPAVGMPPFGKDEAIFAQARDGGKVIASGATDVGA